MFTIYIKVYLVKIFYDLNSGAGDYVLLVSALYYKTQIDK